MDEMTKDHHRISQILIGVHQHTPSVDWGRVVLICDHSVMIRSVPGGTSGISGFHVLPILMA